MPVTWLCFSMVSIISQPSEEAIIQAIEHRAQDARFAMCWSLLQCSDISEEDEDKKILLYIICDTTVFSTADELISLITPNLPARLSNWSLLVCVDDLSPEGIKLVREAFPLCDVEKNADLLRFSYAISSIGLRSYVLSREEGSLYANPRIPVIGTNDPISRWYGLESGTYVAFADNTAYFSVYGVRHLPAMTPPPPRAILSSCRCGRELGGSSSKETLCACSVRQRA